MPKYMQCVAKSADVPEIQRDTIAMFKEATDVVFPGKRFELKDDVEPQSEIEDLPEKEESKDEFV